MRLEVCRDETFQNIIGHANRQCGRFKRVLHRHTVFLTANDQSDSLQVAWLLELAVDRDHVCADLSDIGRIEFSHFHFDDIVATLDDIIEQHVDRPLRFPNLQLVFTSEIGEPLAEFLQKLFDVPDQFGLQFLFAILVVHCDETEVVGILERFLREIAVRVGQRNVKVRLRRTLAKMEVRGDVVLQHGSAPSVLDRLADIEKSSALIALEFVHDMDMVSPRNGKEKA